MTVNKGNVIIEFTAEEIIKESSNIKANKINLENVNYVGKQPIYKRKQNVLYKLYGRTTA